MTLRDFYLKRAKAEFPVFLKVLKALPKDLSYKPNDRSPSAEQLVWTVTYELKALIDVVDTGKSEWQNITPPGLDEMIGMFEKWSTELLDKVAKLDDASQERNAQFIYQGQVVMEKPMVEFLWDFMFDAIHHRGQLSAYLRPMGAKVLRYMDRRLMTREGNQLQNRSAISVLARTAVEASHLAPGNAAGSIRCGPGNCRSRFPTNPYVCAKPKKTRLIAQSVELLAFNHWVAGSSLLSSPNSESKGSAFRSRLQSTQFD